MIARAALAALLLTATAASAAPANPDFTCKLVHPATIYDSLKRLPPALARAVRGKIGAMADRGEFFNATDAIVRPGPSRRFIRAGHAGAKWFAWYEQGGLAYFKSIVVFVADAHGALEVTGEYQGAFDENMCADTDRILDRRPLAH